MITPVTLSGQSHTRLSLEPIIPNAAPSPQPRRARETMLSRVLLAALLLMPVVYLWPGVELPYALAKTLHVLGMAVIAVLVCRLDHSVLARGVLLAAILAASAGLEWLQSLLPTRTGAVEDVGFNLAGCLAGIAAYGIWQNLSARGKEPLRASASLATGGSGREIRK